jgi:hypothetical protein
MMLVGVALMIATSVLAHAPGALPPAVISDAPGIHPLGHGKHAVWGITVYSATLWVVGRTWTLKQPHAMELESGRSIPADSLVKAAVDEMRDLKLGDRTQVQTWSGEMRKVLPNLKKGDKLVIFCPASGKTIVFVDDRETGEVDDTSLCPAVMNIWLHPAASKSDLRRSLLQQQ